MMWLFFVYENYNMHNTIPLSQEKQQIVLDKLIGRPGWSWFEASPFTHPLRKSSFEAGAGLKHLASQIL